jgi:hypothetical protein
MYSFEPEAAFRSFSNSSGIEVPLNAALRDAVSGYRPMIEFCAAAVSKSSREYELLVELLCLIE